MVSVNIEVGPLPTDDPTLDEGAVLVSRSVLLNMLFAHVKTRLTAENDDVAPEIIADMARIEVLTAIRRQSANPVLQDGDFEKMNDEERMARVLLTYILSSIANLTNNYTSPIDAHLAMVSHNTLIVIYYQEDEGFATGRIH